MPSNKQQIQWARIRRNSQEHWITANSWAGADSSNHEVVIIGVARGVARPPPIALQPMKNLLPKRLALFRTRSKIGLWLDRRPWRPFCTLTDLHTDLLVCTVLFSPNIRAQSGAAIAWCNWAPLERDWTPLFQKYLPGSGLDGSFFLDSDYNQSFQQPV